MLLMTAALASGHISAQNIPTLPKAPEISTGKLPNGVTYYIATNTVQTGLADFALVSRGAYSIEETRRSLSRLPHFQNRSPYRFLADLGVGYRKDGLVSYQPDARIFRFDNVPVSNQTVTDSTLLMMFDLTAETGGQTAMVICGDVNAGKLTERMQMLSMLVVPGKAAPVSESYRWVSRDSITYEYRQERPGAASTLEIEYRTPRSPRDMMNTAQPQVSGMFARMLGVILRERLEYVFNAYDAPLAYVSTRYTGSASTYGDEKFTINVVTDPSRLAMGTSMTSTVLSELDQKGASLQEFRMARSRVIAAMRRSQLIREVSNADYTEKCIAAYLYGADLANASTISSFLGGRKVDESLELELFNRFVSAMLDPSHNLTIRCTTPWCPVAKETIPELFSSSWSNGAQLGIPSPADTSRMVTPSRKVKIKATAAEPVTGGQLWTFSNGIKVIYKKSQFGGEFRYALMVKGGYTGIPGLQDGESAFASDMLGLYKVAGMDNTQMREMLRDNGITMNYGVTLTDMRISGMAPSSRLQLLLKTLLSLSGSRECDREAFEYYRRCEDLRIRDRRMRPQGVNAWLDSLVTPGFFYTEYKNQGKVRDDFQHRCDLYFERQFSSMDNAILVLVGDLQEAELKKQLCRFLGDFRTGGSRVTRNKVSIETEDTWRTITESHHEAQAGPGIPGVNMVMSAKVPFSTDAYMAFKVTRKLLEKSLVSEMAGYGMHVEVADKVERFPLDRYTVFINAQACCDDNLPAGVHGAYPMLGLQAVRRAVISLLRGGISDADLKSARTAVINDIGSRIAHPDEMVNAVLMRNAEGTDLVSGYKEKAGAVSRQTVLEILSALDKGTRIEYIIN